MIRKYCNTALDNTLYCIGGTWFAVLQYGPWMGFFCIKIFIIVKYHKMYSAFFSCLCQNLKPKIEILLFCYFVPSLKFIFCML